jgi:microcompartment protein CcmL/EutN
VKRPRDKAAAENAVNVVNKRVIGYLDDDVFTTLTELNDAIEERVREINHDIRRADDTTRWERFVTEEAALLGPPGTITSPQTRNGIPCPSPRPANCSASG